MKDTFTPEIRKAFLNMLIGNLRDYAHNFWKMGDEDEWERLNKIADAIEEGTAGETEILEAIEEVAL